MRLCFLTRNQISTNYRYIEIISVQKKVVISYYQNQILCKSKVGISCQRAKYQLIADIIKFQWLGVKVSYTMHHIIRGSKGDSL